MAFNQLKGHPFQKLWFSDVDLHPYGVEAAAAEEKLRLILLKTVVAKLVNRESSAAFRKWVGTVFEARLALLTNAPNAADAFSSPSLHPPEISIARGIRGNGRVPPGRACRGET